MKKEKTARGFVLYEFSDVYDVSCSIQQSSSVTPRIWIGAGENRIHADKKLAKKIIKIMQKFVDEGEI